MKGTTDGTIVLRGIPIVSVLMHCVIKVYNVRGKKKDYFPQRAIMLSHARYFEPFAQKRINLNCLLRIASYIPCSYWLDHYICDSHNIFYYVKIKINFCG